MCLVIFDILENLLVIDLLYLQKTIILDSNLVVSYSTSGNMHIRRNAKQEGCLGN